MSRDWYQTIVSTTLGSLVLCQQTSANSLPIGFPWRDSNQTVQASLLVHHQPGYITFIVCMVYLYRAPTMDPGSFPSFDQLGYYIMDAKIIEIVIKYCRLQKNNKHDKNKDRALKISRFV